MEISFANPHYLWLLLLLPFFALIAFLILLHGKKDIEKFISLRSLDLFFKKANFFYLYLRKHLLIFLLRAAIYLVAVLIISGATFYYRGNVEEQSLIIAIDSSGSMLADDVPPNRLEAVKETIKDFIGKMPQKSRIAVLSFSGNAYIEHGLSSKEEAIKSIDNIQISPISGTSIGSALKTSINILSIEKKPKSILLITDGGENILSDEALYKLISEVEKEHITINVIGIGQIEGAHLPGTELISTLNEQLLKEIAKNTKGAYYRAETKQSLVDAYNRILSSAKLNIPISLNLALIILFVVLFFIDYIFVRYG